MGWTYTYKPKGQSVMDFFKERWDSEDESRKFEVLDCAVMNMREAYLACRVTYKGTGESYTFAGVCLINYVRDRFNFGYKDMDESMGPFYHDCPERILKLLTPLDEFPASRPANENARAWREECWKRVREKKSRPRVSEGTVVRFAEPIRFADGQTVDTFVCENPRRGTFKRARVGEDGTVSADSYMRYKIGRRRERHYAVVA